MSKPTSGRKSSCGTKPKAAVFTATEADLLRRLLAESDRITSEPVLPYTADPVARVRQAEERRFGPACARVCSDLGESAVRGLRRAAKRLEDRRLILAYGSGAYVKHWQLTAAGRAAAAATRVQC